ncbi:hypothetical protein RQP46_003631 [Phenoliferia psychrophenolica]
MGEQPVFLTDVVSPSLPHLPLPATLTHLTIDIVTPASAKNILEALALPALALLERIKLVKLSAGALEAAEDGVELIEECERRGIGLVFRQDLL